MNATGPLITIALAALLWLLDVTLEADTANLTMLPREWLHQLALGLSVLGATQVVQRLLALVLLRPGREGRATSELLRAVMGMALYMVAGMLFLRYGLGLDVSNVLATSAIVTIIVGLALQPLLGHLFAGMSIELERPLRVGDYVRRADLEGRVVSMNWRSLRLLTWRKSVFVMPNSDFTGHAFEVFPAGQPCRHDVPFSLPADIPPGLAIRVFMQVLRSGVAGVCLEPEPSVGLTGNDTRTGKLNYVFRFYTLDYLGRAIPTSHLLERFWYALSREGHGFSRRDDGARPDTAGDPAAASAARDARVPDVLLACARRRSYARHERVRVDGAALIVRGSLQATCGVNGVHDEEAVQALLDRAAAATGAVDPPRLGREQLAALVDDAKLVLGPLAHALCGRVAALTDDPYLAYRVIARSTPDPAQQAQLMRKAPSRPVRILGPGSWLGWGTALGKASNRDTRAGNQGCDLLAWSRHDLRAGLAAAPEADREALLSRLRGETGDGEPLGEADFDGWLRAA